MGRHEETDEDEAAEVHDEAWAARTFPDRGDAPSNEIFLDERAPPAPNVGHP